MAYHFHVRKNKGLSLSGSFQRSPALIRKVSGPSVDLMFLIAVGALTISLVKR